jgi:predicted permease
MAFCVFLLFAAGLFVRTFERLVHQPLGFTHENVLLLPAESRRTHPPEVWTQLAEQLRATAGVQAVAVAGWAPLTGNRWRASVHVDGRPAERNSPYFLDVSPAYFATLRIPMIQGRDFRGGDPSPRTNEREPPRDGVGIVNEAFARAYFDGANPIGRRVRVRQNKKLDSAMEIIGLVRDAAYDNVREPMRPTVYVPLEQRGEATLLVRTASDPVALAGGLRQAVSRAQPDVRVRATEPLTNFVRAQMIRERLLATLSAFFAVVALLLAAIGLYGVLNHRVLRQQREIGIRMALGARASHVVKDVMARMVVVVCAGSVAGVAAGFVFVRLFEALLFKVRPSDPASVVAPIVVLAAAAALAALPAAIRAVRIDPAQMLRTE